MTQPSPNIEYLQHPHVYAERDITIGKRLVIIAESDGGTLYEPLLVYHKDMAYEFFGGGPLVGAYEDAATFQKGLQVYLMRIEPYGHEVALQVLEAFDFDLLFMKGIRFDKNKDVIEMFIEFCKIKEEKGNLVHGIASLGMQTYGDASKLFPEIEALSVENGDETFENGKYLSLVPDQMDLKDAAAVYAGIITYLNPEVSPINKTIKDVKLTVEYSKQEILSFQEAGIVCFRNTFKKGVTCASSSCAVRTEGSVHKHISNFRIAQFLINEIAISVRPLVGLPHPTFRALNIEDIVDATCIEHRELKRLRDYRYRVGVNDLYGIIDVEIEIVPIFSVHSMTTHSRVRIFK